MSSGNSSAGGGGEEENSGATSQLRRKQRRGSGWTAARRRRVSSEGAHAAANCAPEVECAAAAAVEAQQFRSSELDVPSLLADLPEQLSHEQLARLLWTHAYQLIMLCELKQFEHVSQPVIELFDSLRSARRLELQADHGALLRLSTTVCGLARERSTKVLPFSVVAKSISYLMQRVPIRVWAVGVRAHVCACVCESVCVPVRVCVCVRARGWLVGGRVIKTSSSVPKCSQSYHMS